MDFIQRAVAYKEKGHTLKELQETFGIPGQTYYTWKERLGSGFYNTKEKQVRSRKIDKEKLKQMVRETPDAYLHELAQPFGCTAQAVFYMLENMGITVKKRPIPIVKSRKGDAGNMRRG